MPFVICAVPWFNEVATGLLAAIVALPDVRLGVLSQAPLAELAPGVRVGVVGHRRVDDLRDAGQITAAARELADRHGPIHRLFGPQEQLQAPLAEARERLGVAGMGVEAARNFRDKARMKDRFRAAGLPCARHCLAASAAEAWRFAEEAGYPLVVKPPDGAAAQATFRAGTPDELRAALAASPPAPGRAVLLEEFITGEEHSFDTFSLDGRHVWHSLTHYLPPPLEVLRTPWIQWRVALPREVDAPAYDDIRAAAYRALDVLGMDTGLSHLEWFRRHDGSLAISEVAARPPGAQITKLMSLAHDFDCTAAWARLMIHGAFDPPARRYAAGAAYLRGQGGGRVVAIHGWEQARRELGSLIAEAKLPALGQAASGGYEGEGYVLLRHADTAVVTEALLRLVTVVRVELG